MRSRRLASVAMPIVIVAGSQVGHLLTSELRQGPRALVPDQSGVHAYVPTLSTLALGAAGAAILAALMVVAAARVAAVGQQGAVARPRQRSLLDLAAVLFVLQLAVYVVQETVEAAVGGFARPSAADLLLWGSVGQLPVAALAALLLGWIEARLETAMVELATASGRALGALPVLPPASPRLPVPPSTPSGVSGGHASGRGPPSLRRLT